MKLLLAEAVNEASAIQTKYASLGLGYLVACLPDKLKRNLIIKIAGADTIAEINNFKPDVVGLSSVSQNFSRAKKIAAYCQPKGIKVIIGKSHITALPMSLDKNMDVGIIGEGEETFSEIILLLLENKFIKEELYKIKGIVFHDSDRIVRTAERALIENLDSLPFPDRRSLGLKPGDNFYLFSSRGCPYRCVFCFSSRFWQKIRFHSAEYVVREIKHLVNDYGAIRITFCDDLFIADPERLRKIVQLIKQEKFYKTVKFTVSVRANLISAESARLLKDLGADIVTMGLESGCPRVLNLLKGPSIKIADSRRAIDLLKKNNLQVSASFIIGSPDETRQEILETLSFIKNSRLDLFEVNVLAPLPGTPVWDYALKRGLVSHDMDWEKLEIDFANNHDDYIILSEKLNRQQLKELYDLFMAERRRRDRWLKIKYLYKRPKEILRFLKKKYLAKFLWIFPSLSFPGMSKKN
ncbi:hypothetical protein A3H09_03095 [Candidatus Falkowbacteria bacterium RIFCSPLOWO2_12_FULL_45_13]|uniref:Uncharacterized protein n=1 Tax=Candidatus Falkowbacteria bacterium RIFCSPLOWO2_12_FULL_45_13 TaxID=1797991 RepID=A0A1F5SZE5_9BACT|nr:MAG: hypothetical protein A3H09_03095 [Candidatus Falkowbacteria bacterium RIFCSPLOWO2_12_FULL_45_13]